MEWLVIVVALTVDTASAQSSCHSLCGWVCDSPVCPAVCTPVCQPLHCQRCINGSGGGQVCQATDACTVVCPADECEANACPACQPQCPALCDGVANCTVQCDPLQCGWSCSKGSCRHPICQEVCELPACPVNETSSGAHDEYTTALSMALMGLFIVTQM